MLIYATAFKVRKIQIGRAEGLRLMRELIRAADMILRSDPLNVLYLETTLQAARSAYRRGYHYWRCYVETK